MFLGSFQLPVEPLPAGRLRPAADDLTPEVDALMEFARRLRATDLGAAAIGTGSGASIPFATEPVNLYLRVSDEIKAIPCRLPRLMSHIHADGGQRIMHRLWQRLWPAIRYGQPGDDVGYLTIIPPDSPHNRVMASRISTPKFVADLGDMYPQALAISLLRAAVGVRHELVTKLQQVHAVLDATPHVLPREHRVVAVQFKRPDLHVEKNAYMWSWRAWVTHAGFVYDGRRHSAPRQLEIA